LFKKNGKIVEIIFQTEMARRGELCFVLAGKHGEHDQESTGS